MEDRRKAGFRRAAAATVVAVAALLVPGSRGAGVANAAAQAVRAPADRVDSLAATGRLQEAAWAAREAGDTARATRLLERLETILNAPPVRARPLAMDSQGVSYTFRLDHGDGVGSIFKVDSSDIFCRSCGADREVAAYRIDQLLGLDLTPMTIYGQIMDAGETLVGSTMYFVRDASTPRDVGARKPDRLRFFDALLGNSDRHGSNWLVLRDGRVVAIDHNRAFRYRTASRPKTCWETEVDSIARPGELGGPYERYRSLPDDSLAAAIEGLDAELVRRFIDMRPRVVNRIEQRIRNPRESLPHTDCRFDR